MGSLPEARVAPGHNPLVSRTLVETWRRILARQGANWALFSNGTCVLVRRSGADVESEARALLARQGPVQVGTNTADFNVEPAERASGWVVSCHDPDILTFVGWDELPSGTDDMIVGLVGRSKRDRDASELTVVHVEGDWVPDRP